MPMDAHADVVVFGGGPAGCAAALTIARAGLKVMLCERSSYGGRRFGETLPPTAKPILCTLGLWDAFQADGHSAAPGIVSVWSDSRPQERHFIFNPYGNGWHLDRTRFDRTLSRCAERANVSLQQNVRLRDCGRTSTGEWRLQLMSGDGPRVVKTRYVVDATGRGSLFARRCHVRRVDFDKLVAIVGFATRHAICDRRTRVESVAEGWWYSAVLPDDKCVWALMTDSDLLPPGRSQLTRYWFERHAEASLIRDLSASKDETLDLRVTRCNSAMLERCAGEGWIACGDAALSFDPLSSQGIVTALESGRRAAEAVVAALAGDAAAADGYRQWIKSMFASYANDYFRHYRAVTRWPTSPFWRRRQSTI